MIRRSVKEEFLGSMESWINEVVAKHADGHNELIPGRIKAGFQDALQANMEYHKEMANSLATVDDVTLAKYHTLMVDIYRTFMCK